MISHNSLITDLVRAARTLYGNTPLTVDQGPRREGSLFYRMTIIPERPYHVEPFALDSLDDLLPGWTLSCHTPNPDAGIILFASFPELPHFQCEIRFLFVAPAESVRPAAWVGEVLPKTGHRHYLRALRAQVEALYIEPPRIEMGYVSLREEGSNYLLYSSPVRNERIFVIFADLILALPDWTFIPDYMGNGAVALIARHPALSPLAVSMYFDSAPGEQIPETEQLNLDAEDVVIPPPPNLPSELAPSAWERL